MKNKKLFLFFWIFFFSSFPLIAQEKGNPFKAQWDDSVKQIEKGEKFSFKVYFEVPAGHYIYRDKTDLNFINTAGLKLNKKTFPAGTLHKDPFTQKEQEVYFKNFELTQEIEVPTTMSLGRVTLEAEVHYQGCSTDFCYRPMTHSVLLPFEIVSKKKSEEKLNHPVSEIQNKVPPTSQLEKKNLSFIEQIKQGRLEDVFKQQSYLLYIISFLAGLLTAFTPCVLPVIPITLAIMGFKKNHSDKNPFSLSVLFVLGLSVTFCSLGLMSAYLGLKVGFLFQSSYFLIFLIFLFLFFALSFLGFFELQPPLFIRHSVSKLEGSGYLGAFLSGLSLGLIASPCVGPLLGPLLVWIAQGGNIWKGAFALFCYSLGLGLLFLAIGVISIYYGRKVGSGKLSMVLKKILALFILMPAFYYSWVLYKQYVSPPQSSSWKHSYSEALLEAQKEKKPMFIDFYADWCLPCKEIEIKTLKNKQVEEKLESFVKVKINCTLETPECEEAVNQFNVIGWPTLIFINSNQKYLPELKVVGGVIEPEAFIDLLHKTQLDDSKPLKN